MTPVFPFYTAIYAALLGLLAALLTVNVIVNRVRSKVEIGDGGVAGLAQAFGLTEISPSRRRSPSCSLGSWRRSGIARR